MQSFLQPLFRGAVFFVTPCTVHLKEQLTSVHVEPPFKSLGHEGQKTKNSHIGSKFLESVCQIQSSEKNIVSNFILQNKGNLDETKQYFECYLCNNKLTKRYLLNRHIVSVHEGIKPVECKICCAKLSSKKYLYHHIAL